MTRVWKALAVTRPLLLVDSASLYFRAFFGIPESAARAPDGSPVNAVRGFLDMVATLIRTRRPDRVVCALDEEWRPAWRVALIGSYKTHRLAGGNVEIVPEALNAQIPIIMELLSAFGICYGRCARLRGGRHHRHAGGPGARPGRGCHR